MLRKKILFFIVCCFLIFSCAPKKNLTVLKSPLEMGNYLWSRGEYQKACIKYEKALKGSGLSLTTELFILQRVIKCALDRKDVDKAFLFLSRWKELDKNYLNTWEYQCCFIKYLKLKGDVKEYNTYLKSLLSREDVSVFIKKKVFILLEVELLKQNDILSARESFKDWYNIFTQVDKREILDKLMAIIKNSKDLVYGSYLKLSESSLPDSIILWIRTELMVEAGKISWENAYPIFQNLLKNRDVSYLFLKKFEELKEKYGVPVVEMALILPFDSSYRDISMRILRGVEAGIYEYESKGFKVKLKVINSSNKQWIGEFSSVVKKDLIVGGPLKLSTWKEILSLNLYKKVHFFAFRSTLISEGMYGFRFFPSHEDQVRSLIQFFQHNFHIDSFGIFYPKSEYGRTLGEVFFSEAKKMGSKVEAIGWYDQDNPKHWQKKVAEFLDVPPDIISEKNDDKLKNFIPKLDISAVFIPDSFENVRIIVPSFFYFNVSNMYFLGPALWGTSKITLSGIDRNMFKYAYFPSPWRDDEKNIKIMELKKEVFFLTKEGVDFWTCLGYDFFRFAVRLKERLKPNIPIVSLLNVPEFEWTIAPITWDDKGIARENMYILNVLRDF